MKVLDINGSPKGDYSVTKQYMLYLSKLFVKDSFTILDIGQKIQYYKKIENLNKIKEEINSSDMIIISYPVYTFLPTAQLYEFLETLSTNNIDFNNKFVTQFTTSKHFYDVTAHKTLKECILDYNGKYVDGFSADMEDLTNNKVSELIDWYKYLRFQVDNDIYEFKTQEKKEHYLYKRNILISNPKEETKTIALITDVKENESLVAMIDDYIAYSKYKVIVYNLNGINMKCGCLGCLNCMFEGKCAINDDYYEILNEINKCDGFINAFTIKNHSMSSTFKKFYDRQFVNGHRPVNYGKPIGYIISGNLDNEPQLKEYIDAKSSVGGNYNVGIINDSKNTLNSIYSLELKMSYMLEHDYKKGNDFYEIGGMKIFRDMIYVMQGLMKEDYQYYKKNNLLDFPQKNKRKIIGIRLVGMIFRNKKIRNKMGNAINDGMISPYKKIIKNVKTIE